MRRSSLPLALLVLATPRPVHAGVAEELGLSEPETAFCSAEIAIVDNRRKLFAARGLSRAEQHERNAQAEADLAACRKRFRQVQREDEEDRSIQREAEQRLPPTASDVQRAEAERQVRLERARKKPASSLTAQERQLLEEEESKATRERSDAQHARDPRFRRPAVSALLCLQERQLSRARADREQEQRLTTMGAGENNRLYYLRAEIHRLEENVATERAELSEAGGPLPCNDPKVSALERCVALPAERAREDEACQTEPLASYLRALR